MGSALAGIDRELSEMRDEVQDERVHVLDGQNVSTQPEQKPQQRRAARGLGFDAEL